MGGAVAERQPGRSGRGSRSRGCRARRSCRRSAGGCRRPGTCRSGPARPWRATASSGRGSGLGPRRPRRACSGAYPCPRARLLDRAAASPPPGGTSTGCCSAQPLSELLDELPDLGALHAVEGAPRPARRARKYSSREPSAWPRTTWDHSSCRKRASQPVIAQLEQHRLPRSTALESSIQCRRVPGSASVTTLAARASMLTTSTRSRDRRPGQLKQPCSQVGGEVLVERGEQDVLAVTGRLAGRPGVSPGAGRRSSCRCPGRR